MPSDPTGKPRVVGFGKAAPAIDYLLAGLIDYAGLFPPASLDMRSAVGNYLDYRRGSRAGVLGRFVVSLDRLGEMRSAAGAV